MTSMGAIVRRALNTLHQSITLLAVRSPTLATAPYLDHAPSLASSDAAWVAPGA